MSTYHKLGMIMFADTFSGRMLRRLCLAQCMPQAEFMSDYMRRCDRKLTRWAKPGQTKPNPSSFGNNFGRFVANVRSWGGGSPNRELRVIRQDEMAAHSANAPKARSMLVWVGPRPEALFAALTDADLELFSERLERQMLAPHHTDTDACDESAPWLAAVRREIDSRATAGIRKPAVRSRRKRASKKRDDEDAMAFGAVAPPA